MGNSENVEKGIARDYAILSLDEKGFLKKTEFTETHAEAEKIYEATKEIRALIKFHTVEEGEESRFEEGTAGVQKVDAPNFQRATVNSIFQNLAQEIKKSFQAISRSA